MSVATQIIQFGLMSGRHLDDQVGDQIGGSASASIRDRCHTK
jgi:hypothetical protein